MSKNSTPEVVLGEYLVRFNEERIFNSIRIYKYNPKAFLFKKKFLMGYLECAMKYDAILSGCDVQSENGLYNLAQYTLDFYLRSQEIEKEANRKRVNQENFLKNLGKQEV